MDNIILDACCGSRMFWFDKNCPSVDFADIRKETHTLCDGRKLEVSPDLIMDFTSMPIEDNRYKLVIFDPPHLKNVGANSWMFKKYGSLSKNYKEVLEKGFSECFRVLDETGVLIFKWNETQIKTSDIIALAPYKPLIGHRSGKASKTHWVTFIKIDSLKIK